MTRVRLAAAFAAVAVLAACTPSERSVQTSSNPVGDRSQCEVTAVVDGDTFRCADVGRVRIVGINAPELAHGTGERDQCYGQESRRALAGLIEGQYVTITTDPTQGTRDRYGRRLGYIATPEARDVGHQLVADGAARAVFVHPRSGQYEAAERAARQQQRALWRACGSD